MIYFGTDGIRGIVGESLTQEICFKCGNALTQIKKGCKIIIGRDTRKSGSFIVSSFVSGVTMGGATVIDVGILPSPAVSVLTKQLKADFGVMITASHNPPEYNGIKIFDSNGKKISPKKETEIEQNFVKQKIEKNSKLGKYIYKPKLYKEYIKFLSNCVNFKFMGLKVVLDASNGASYLVANKIFKKLGAKVIKINCNNKGEKINTNCGALYPQKMSSLVKKYGANVGFAFDGDADRIVVADESGNIIDGDQILLYLTDMYKQFNLLKSGAIVGTTQTNMSVETELRKKGLKLIRTDVGDKYVTEEMENKNLQIGGEQSGHIILMDYEKTGDAILCALVISKFILQSNKKLSEVIFNNLLKQHSQNFMVSDKYQIINSTALKVAISECEQLLNGEGRIVVRASGTEPKIRVMVELQNENLAQKILKKLEKVINEQN